MSDDRRQTTVRFPPEVWEWVMSYYKARRAVVEEDGTDVRYTRHEALIELVQAGLSVRHPISSIRIVSDYELQHGERSLQEVLEQPAQKKWGHK